MCLMGELGSVFNMGTEMAPFLEKPLFPPCSVHSATFVINRASVCLDLDGGLLLVLALAPCCFNSSNFISLESVFPSYSSFSSVSTIFGLLHFHANFRLNLSSFIF